MKQGFKRERTPLNYDKNYNCYKGFKKREITSKLWLKYNWHINQEFKKGVFPVKYD